jgi:uncharacterized protein YndB with AHSA1/START domain
MNTEMKTFDVVLTRTFDAPLALVWQAWSDAEQVMRWWGPTYFTSPLCRMDFREGGTTLVCMRTPDGHDMYNTWNYTKIVPMQRIEYIVNFSDKDGNKFNPADMGMPPGIPMSVPHVVTFYALSDNKTEITISESGYTSAQIVNLSRQGLEQCLDKMAASFL